MLRFHTRSASKYGRVDARRVGTQRDGAGAAKVVRSLGETVTAVVLSADTLLFGACATNGKAIICHVDNGEVIAEFKAESGINAAAMGLEGDQTRLIVGTFSGWIRVYHVMSGTEEHHLRFGDGASVQAMALAAQGTRLAVGGKASHIRLYALSLNTHAVGMALLYAFKTHGNSTLSVSLDDDAKFLVAGGDSKVVQLWEVPDPNQESGGSGRKSEGTGQKSSLFRGVSKRWHNNRITEEDGHMDGEEEEDLKVRVMFRTSTIIHSIAINQKGAFAVPAAAIISTPQPPCCVPFA